MNTHTIRLRGAWVVTTAAGRTRHARKFGRPRTRGDAERVWLVCASVPGPADVFLNGERIGTATAGKPFAVDVTSGLLARNEVVFDAASADPLGEVAVEIRG